MKRLSLLSFLIFSLSTFSQSPLTIETLWKLGRVSALGITKDGQALVYKVSRTDLASGKNKSELFQIPLKGGEAIKLDSLGDRIADRMISPDGTKKIGHESVKLENVFGKEMYSDLPNTSAQIYDDLHHRHWDSWEDGKYNHVFLYKLVNGKTEAGIDLMKNEKFDTPTVPMGDESDYTWSSDGNSIVYVCKKKYGKDYVLSTNTDIYIYDINLGTTFNLTEGRMGYDTDPAFSPNNDLAWLSMRRDGYEADKNDIIVKGFGKGAKILNLTERWDGTVKSYRWSNDGKKIYFVAPVNGTNQLMEVDYPGLTKKLPVVRPLVSGDFDINDIIGQSGELLVLSRTDMNHATEMYTYHLKTNELKQLTHVNDAAYSGISTSRTERRLVKTTDGKDMLVWVVYPPNFDPAKKYPTLLYCQGGPQSALTQFYSFRWNFQLMAANGYIVVAPNRRGMPGHGVQWNEAISKDWGGQVMKDYLSAIDDVSKESYVDKSRLGCIGASYGGYSVFYLAGIHQKRFKSFIAHAGVFDLKSMYGTTEELFFTNFDMGGAYWEKDNAAAQKSYAEFNPSDRVGNWDTPMLVIHGGLDYRVPESQGFQAYTALQLKGIKSRLLYFPDENHWILQPHNAMTWQREFYRWLRETL
jgi:dipeptidyl aminopeptidase/acylaminoacyl peptidase